MKKNLAQEIQIKTAKLLEIKKRYNDLVKAVDEEFSEKINQFNEKKIHVPLDLAKPILQALKKGNTQSEEFKNHVKQFSELINFISDSESESESDHHYLINKNDENIEGDSQPDDNSENESPLQSIVSNKNDFDIANTEEDALISGDDGSDDSLNQIDDVQLDMEQFINQNYDAQEDLDGL